jgi:hypothetical protein
MTFLLIAWFILAGIAIVCFIIWVILTIKIAAYKRELRRLEKEQGK